MNILNFIKFFKNVLEKIQEYSDFSQNIIRNKNILNKNFSG